MKLKTKALEALAAELRKAAVGVAAVLVAGGYANKEPWLLIAGGAWWLALQAFAFAIECYENSEE